MIAHSQVNRDARVARSAQALKQAGLEVHLICLSDSREPQQPDAIQGVLLHPIPKLTFSLAHRPRPNESPGLRILLRQKTRALLRILARPSLRYGYFLLLAIWITLRIRPHVVHAHDLNVLLVGSLGKLLLRSKLIYDSHEIFVEKVAAKNLKRFWFLLERVLIRFCDSVIVTTEARADVLSDLYSNIPPPSVIHNFPYPHRGMNRDIREIAELPRNSFVALYQGGVQAERGLEVLISAAEYMASICVVIQGDGPLFDSISALAKRSPNSERLRVIQGGTFSHLREYTSSANVGIQILQPVSLNHTTTISNKLVEYCHAGIPVVASDFPMIRKLIEEYQFGILVDPTDPKEVAGAISSIQQSSHLRNEMAANARKASSWLSWERESQRLVSIYRSMGVELKQPKGE